MGLIHIELFATLDLVGQAPGGPEEDSSDDFPFGGWQAPLMDDVAGAQVGAAYEATDALLLGRRTYDIFAGFWPYQEGGQDDDIATLFNLSLNTVKHHITHVFNKLNVSNRLELALFAINNHLVDDSLESASAAKRPAVPAEPAAQHVFPRQA